MLLLDSLTFVDFIKDMFAPDNTQETIAIAVIVGGSFLLGILLYWLFFALPKNIRRNRELRIATERLEVLEKEHAEIKADFKIVSDKHKTAENDLATAQMQVIETTNRNIGLKNQIETLNTKVENAKKAQDGAMEELGELKRLYKYAQAAITESERIAQNAQQETTVAQGHIQQAQRERDQARAELQRLHGDYDQANTAAEEYRKDLESALQQLQSLQTQNEHLAQLSEQHEGLLSQNEALQNQVQSLQNELDALRAEKDNIHNQLNNFTQAEEEHRQEIEAEQAMFDGHLQTATETMSSGPFFSEIQDLIEDEQRLKENLAQNNQPRNIAQEPAEPEVELDDDERDALEIALDFAKKAMKMPGFYREVDPNSLQPITDTDTLDDDALIGHHLDLVQRTVENSDFHREIPAEEMIENPELHAQRLSETIEAHTIVEEEPAHTLSADEELELKKALDYAQLAISTEGFYAPMPAEKLVETTPNTQQFNALAYDAKYKTDIEKAVVMELGRIVPRANEQQKQDLKRINGIGIFIEQKLNHLGIYTYEQIAHFDESFAAKLTAAIGFAEDTILRDNWVEQAKQLVAKQKIQHLTQDLDKNKTALKD